MIMGFAAPWMLPIGAGTRAVVDIKGCRKEAAESSHTYLSIGSILLLGLSGSFPLLLIKAAVFDMSVNLQGYLIVSVPASVLSIQASLSWEKVEELRKAVQMESEASKAIPKSARNN